MRFSNAGKSWRTRPFTQILGIIFLFGVGLWLRGGPVANISARLSRWQPKTGPAMVTLYFSDESFLFPVSRRMPANDTLPQAALQMLLNGPPPGSELKNSVPPGVEIRSFRIAAGVAEIDLSARFLAEPGDIDAAKTAVVDTLTGFPGVHSVALSVEGRPLIGASRRIPLLYFASANGLAAVPVSVDNPRTLLATYLQGPSDAHLSGLPNDVRLLKYDYNPADLFVSVNFTYSPSVRELALDRPERMRTVLLGLIASLTEFPDVRAVQLDFEGQTRLGLGECSDLLRSPQPRPQLLNDERLLDRWPSSH